MTQWEKMISVRNYDAQDPELDALRRRAEALCHQLSLLSPHQEEQRQVLLRELLGAAGKDLSIRPGFWCDYGSNIEIGEDFYTNHNCTILDGAKVTFGDHVFIAPNCVFSTAGHPLDAEQRNQGLEYAYPITVGDNVWIGASVTVLPGVTIGSNTIIGAGSVVNRDIPDGVVAVGNPCRVLRKITEEDKKKYWKGENK